MYPTQENKAALAAKQAELEQLEPVLALYQQIYTNLVVLGKPVEGEPVNSTRLSQLEKMLSLYQEIYINLLTSIESVRLARLQNTPNVVQIEAAALPSEPIRPKPLQNTLLAAALGLMLAAGIVFLIEYLDDTIKSVDDVERLLQLPVVGYIARMQYGPDSDERLYVVRQPRSPVAEAFRSLRTNLEFSSVDKPLRRLLVTSASPNDGKTTIAANLAAIMAQGGKRVILLDADMRKPQVHRFLGVSNRVGLSDVFRGSIPMSMVLQTSDRAKDVTVVTSGSLPPNPTELLASSRMDQILDELGERGDIMVIDGPPSLVADVQVLASKVDGVVIVVQPGHTHADEAVATLEQLARTGAHVVGVVFNRIPRDRFYYYGGYRYYSPYHNNGYSYYSSRETAHRDDLQDEQRRVPSGLRFFSGDADRTRPRPQAQAEEKAK
jgi:capsular exopolysaccharide synthesis family protein